MTQESHGRLSFAGWKGRLALPLLMGFPVVIALASGAWLAFQALSVRFENAEAGRLSEVTTLVRSAADNLKDEISVLRSEALSIRELQRVDSPDLLPSLFHSILCAAEVETRDGAAPVVSRLLKRPNWAEGAAIDEAYLAAALSRVDWAEFSKDGMAVLRLKQDPSRNAEWLAFVFPILVPRGAPRGAALAIVDPAEAFPLFSRWNGRSENGSLRAYLVGGDGTVLVHSQRSYAGADFSRTEIFQHGIASLLEGKRESGNGKFLSIDQLPAQAAYVKAGTLPLGLVVERLEPLSADAPFSGLGTGALGRAMLERIAMPLLAVLSALAAFVFLGSAWVRSRFVALAETARGSRRSTSVQAEPQPESQGESETMAALEEAIGTGASVAGAASWAVPSANGRAIRNAAGDLFTIQEVRAPSVARTAANFRSVSPASEHGGNSEARGGMDAQLAEQALSRELMQDAAKAREQQRKRIAIAQFEADLTDLTDAAQPEAVQAAVSKLTGLARELCHTPSFFFAFRPEEKRAVLTACSGLGAGADISQLAGLGFSVADELPARVAQSAQAGRIHSLSDYVPLAAVIMRNFQAMDFRAWAVPGGKSGRFLGALVVLSAEGESLDGVRQNTESLARIIRTTGIFYENALSGPQSIHEK